MLLSLLLDLSIGPKCLDAGNVTAAIDRFKQSIHNFISVLTTIEEKLDAVGRAVDSGKVRYMLVSVMKQHRFLQVAERGTRLQKINVDDQLDFRELASMTEGSDLKNLFTTSSYRPVSELIQAETQKDLDKRKRAAEDKFKKMFLKNEIQKPSRIQKRLED